MEHVAVNQMKKELKEVRIFGWEDLSWLARREKKKLFRFASIGFFCALCFLGARGASYTIEASFKEQKEESGLESRDLVKQLFSGSLGSSSSHTQALMKSRKILKPLIEKLGLQIKQSESRFFLTFLELWRAEWKKPLKDLDRFRFSDVCYEGEKTVQIHCVFLNEKQFDLLEKGKKIASGSLGEKVVLPNFLKFCIQKAPQNLKIGKKYRFRIDPWLKIANSLRKKISIVPQKTSSSLYDLSYKTRDRVQGALLLNQLTEEFQIHLKKEHDLLAEKQLAYLAKRKFELSSQLELDLQERASHMSEQLQEKGFLNASQQFEVFLEPHNKMMNELFAIDLELQQLEKEGPFLENSPLCRSLYEKKEQLKNLFQQRDLLEISISKTPFASAESFQIIEKELEEIRARKQKIEVYLQDFSWSPDLMVSAWAEKLKPSDLDETQKKEIQDYLAGRSRLLSFREKILSERLLYKGAFPSEFEGIDWETSRTLYREYTHLLDETERKISSLTDTLLKMSLQDRELGCFSAMLKDPLSQHLIASANTLYLQLKERKYCSAKEEIRWQEDLELQKKLLKEHIEQMLEIERTHLELMREKLFTLQQVGLDCIHQQISLLEEHIREEMESRRKELLQEKLHLQKKMEEVRLQFAALPETWAEEQLFSFKSQADQKIMEAIAQLVETKSIGHHLHQVGSRAIDPAILPILPDSPHALLILLIGMFASSGSYFLIHFLRHSARGFPMTAAKLKALDLPFSGELSSGACHTKLENLFQEDLDTLRCLASFIDSASGPTVVGLLGKGADFSQNLAELGAQMGKKICMIDARFSNAKMDSLGLLQFLDSTVAKLPVQQLGSVDYLPSGGYTPFGAEKLQSERIFLLLEELKKHYDWIFFINSASLGSAESKTFLKICDRVAISLRGEQIDLLTPFISWAYDKEYCRLTFVASKFS